MFLLCFCYVFVILLLCFCYVFVMRFVEEYRSGTALERGDSQIDLFCLVEKLRAVSLNLQLWLFQKYFLFIIFRLHFLNIRLFIMIYYVIVIIIFLIILLLLMKRNSTELLKRQRSDPKKETGESDLDLVDF